MGSLILMLGGITGMGKSMQSLLYKDTVPGVKKVVIDLEDKAANTYEAMVRRELVFGDITLKSPTVIGKNCRADHIETYKKLLAIIEEIINKNEYDVIVLDSVSYLRNNICADYHCAAKGKRQVGTEAWREVNDNMRDIVFTLIRYSRLKGKTLILTCHMKDEYRDGQCVGLTFDTKDDIDHACDVIIRLNGTVLDNVYTAQCHRSNAGGWEEDISGMSPLDAILEEKGII